MKIELEAQMVLRDFQPDCLQTPQAVNIEKFLEGRLPKITGVITDYKRTSTGIYGWTDSSKMEVVISLDLIETKDKVKLRQGRATMSHEVPHAIYHIPQLKKHSDELRSIHDSKHSNSVLFHQEDIPAYRNPEWQAWRWGKAFMMPLPIVVKLFRDGCNEYQMAEIFNLNPKYVRGRLGDLQRIGQTHLKL